MATLQSPTGLPASDSPTTHLSWRANAIYPQRLEQLAPCRSSCPNGNDIRGWIGYIAQRERLGLSMDEAMYKAWQLLVEFNPLPAVLGRICPHPCEDRCNRLEKEGAVAIHSLERSIGDWALAHQLPLSIVDSTPKPESIGVVGTGPAGLSFAYQMARQGYAVTMYEQYKAAGGMMRYGIPNYRLPRAIIEQEVERILQLGVVLKLNTRIGRDITAQELRTRHQHTFVGIGAHQPLTLGIPGEIGPQVLAGAHFMYQANSRQKLEIGRRVAVVGGGNTAIDAARTARRLGAEVTLLYRRTEAEMPAIAEEVADAKAEGVALQFLVTPRAIIREHGQLIGLQLQRMIPVRDEIDDKSTVIPIPDAVYTMAADMVIVAVSQQPDWSDFSDLSVVMNHPAKLLHGSIAPGWWSGGDAVSLGTASQAVCSGRQAAKTLHCQLRGLTMPAPLISAMEPLNIKRIRLDYYQPSPRTVVPRCEELSKCECITEQEVYQNLSTAQISSEASRCLSCGACYGCQQCWMYCNVLAYSSLAPSKPGSYFAFDANMCLGCGKCTEICPTGYLSAAIKSV